ncbi:MAG: S49 family peptidase, partial [Phycisphaerales bacterium]
MRRTCVSLVLAIAGAALVGGAPVVWAGETPVVAAASKAKPASVTMITLDESPRERPGKLDWLMGSSKHPTLRQIVEAIDDVAEADEAAGLLIRVRDADLSLTQIEEIGAAMKRVRASGKHVHVFAENFGLHEVMLGGYADGVLGQSGGGVAVSGIYTEEMYLADTLAWAGVKADMVQIGAYKGANEQMTRSSPSPEWSTNIDQLLDTLYASARTPILEGRHFTPEKLDSVMSQTWLADMNDAEKLGLIDKQVDLPELTKGLGEMYGKAIELSDIDVGDSGELNPETLNPFAIMSIFKKTPDVSPKGPAIAIVHVDGAIIDGDSTEGGLMGGASVGSRTIRNALEDIAENDKFKGVLLRIDSPGGSAIASEIIWQGLKRVAAKKPVWVSVGGMAASGGYYIASAGEKIFVSPSSIVGSIGVVGGKYSMKGLYDTLKVHITSRSRGPRAGMFASDRAWSPEELASVRAKMTQTFDQFKARVAAGRPKTDLAKTAGGWLFSGRKAIDMGLADEIGGQTEALDALATNVGLADDYEVFEFPAPRAL